MRGLFPPYPRKGRPIGVIHFGVGAFHRAHQAVYFDQAIRNGLGEWGIYGISPRSREVTDKLRIQEFLYTVNSREGESQNPLVIGSILDGSIFEFENQNLQSAALSRELKIITITTTEKAYVSGREIRSMPNRLIDLLFLRFHAELSAPTLVSCDNLPNNGEFLRRVIVESAFERKLDDNFLDWLNQLSIPNSMVDRIVPASTNDAIVEFERDFGYRDESLISTEPFKQWVIAPNEGSHELSKFGVEISDEVERYEQLKLRVFNGAHSPTAYFSQLSGIEYVYQAMQNPIWNQFIARLQEQISTSFLAPHGVDVVEYGAVARSRIANSALAHRSSQIAMDGSAKLPQRLFVALNTLAHQRKPRERLAFAISLWIRYLQSGAAVVDPLATELIERANRATAYQSVSAIMTTPGLRNPVVEEDWTLISHYLHELQRSLPLDVAAQL